MQLRDIIKDKDQMIFDNKNQIQSLQIQLQVAKDDLLIKEQQTTNEIIEKIKKQSEVQIVQIKQTQIQNTKDLSDVVTTYMIFQNVKQEQKKEIDKLRKKLDSTEKKNKEQEKIINQKNRIMGQTNSKKNQEFEGILDEKNKEILNLQQTIKELKKNFKQEDRIVKDLASKESQLNQKVIQLQEENQKLAFDLKRVMRISQQELKSIQEENKQKNEKAKEKQIQYEKFLQVQQKQVERFQKQLLTLKSRSQNTQKPKKIEYQQLYLNNQQSSLSSNRVTTERSKRSQSLLNTKKNVQSQNSVQQGQYFSQKTKNSGNSHRSMNGQQSDTIINRQHQIQDDPYFYYQTNPQTQPFQNNYTSVQNKDQYYYNDNQNIDVQEQEDEDFALHQRIIELQKQLIEKQNENLELQEEYLKDSQQFNIQEIQNNYENIITKVNDN